MGASEGELVDGAEVEVGRRVELDAGGAADGDAGGRLVRRGECGSDGSESVADADQDGRGRGVRQIETEALAEGGDGDEGRDGAADVVPAVLPLVAGRGEAVRDGDADPVDLVGVVA